MKEKSCMEASSAWYGAIPIHPLYNGVSEISDEELEIAPIPNPLSYTDLLKSVMLNLISS